MGRSVRILQRELEYFADMCANVKDSISEAEDRIAAVRREQRRWNRMLFGLVVWDVLMFFFLCWKESWFNAVCVLIFGAFSFWQKKNSWKSYDKTIDIYKKTVGSLESELSTWEHRHTWTYRTLYGHFGFRKESRPDPQQR